MNTNALKHGCCALDTQLLATEKQADFQALESLWLNAYNPQSPAERHLVQELVQADWLLQRTTRTVAEIETRLYADQPNPLDWTDHQQRTLGRFLRYRTAHTNTVNKCRKALEDFRKARQKDQKEKPSLKPAAPPQPELNWKQHLEQMRQKAIALGYTPPDPEPRGLNPPP